MENENHKKKIELMNSIMKNPKMARSFKDAMSSPIGSTKREQAKSVLSIMKKVGGLRNDGMGGPLDSMSSNQSSILNTPNSSSILNSSPSSYYIFPAAPALKSSNLNLTLPSSSSSNANGALTGNTDTTPKNTNLFSGFNNLISTFPKVDLSGLGLTLPNTTGESVDTGLVSNGQSVKAPVYKAPVTPLVNNTPTDSTALTPGQFGGTSTTPTTPDQIKQLQTKLNTQNAGQANWVPLKVDGIMGPKTTAALTFGSPDTTTNTNTDNTNTTGKTDSGVSSSFASSSNVFNIAASSVATLLKLSPTTPLTQVPVEDLASAIATNEGFFNGTSKIAIANNNPGNLKFANQPGATADSNGFAVFATVDEGAQALVNDLTSKYNSGQYKTINDLMSVYSPDSDNPSSPTYSSNSSNTSSPITKDSTGDQIKSAAQTAVNANTGPATFAMTVANAKFDGSLSQYISDLDAKLKTQFNLEPLETQLSNLKSESTAFIPTLTSYIQGKDQYSKAIDSLISKAEGQLTTTNMADPFTANQYKNYVNYLYTLKGRQDSRYSQYLTSAVADYNADVTKTQNNYDTIYKRYTDALTQKGTLAQNEYNQLYTAMSDLYTSLDNAPTKANNAKIQEQQIAINNATLAQNAITAGATTNPNYWKDVDSLTKELTDQNATGVAQNNLDTNKLGAAGLAGFFAENSYAASDPQAAAKAINNVFASTLTNSTDKIADLSKLKKLVTDLSQTNGGAPLAAMISPTLNKAGYSTVSDYVLANYANIKSAAQTLVSGQSHWFSKNDPVGLTNEAAWKKKYSNINSGVLDDLYNVAKTNITPGSAYEKDPSTFISTLFAGADDNSRAANVASNLMSTW